MQIVMRVTFREVIALLLVLIGCGAATTILFPIVFQDEIIDVRQLEIFVPTSFIFLGLGCGILTRHPLTYLLGAAGAISFAALNM